MVTDNGAFDRPHDYLLVLHYNYAYYHVALQRYCNLLANL